MRRLVSDTVVMAERNIVRLPRQPDLFTAFTVQPIMFVLLFVYVFGGAINTPGYDSYKDFPEYRYMTKADDTKILEDRMRRVTDTSIPEDEAFRAVEKHLVPTWKKATASGERRFWHEYFYELIQALPTDLHQGNPEDLQRLDHLFLHEIGPPRRPAQADLGKSVQPHADRARPRGRRISCARV